MLTDFRSAWRGLLRSPSFTVASVVTLGLGIGAATTMFSVLNSVVLRPLPGYQTGRVVTLCDTSRGGCRFLHPDLYLRLRTLLHSYATLAANQNCRMNLTGLGEAEQLGGPCTTANWFDMQHAEAMLGRTFLPDEDQHGRNHVVVLDYGFWRRRFGGDRRIVGQPLTLDREPWVVIGVMPRGFTPVGEPASPIYTAYVVADNPHGLNVLARLKNGASIGSAQAELNVAAQQLGAENPDWRRLRLRAVPMLEHVSGEQRPLLLLLFGAVSFVLLIACTNVADLLLARGTARHHEIDIRIALGASRARILRFLFAEALLIAGAAGIAACAMAWGGLRAFTPLTANLPRSDELSLDWRVFIAAALLGLLSAVLVALAPALRPVRTPRTRTATGKSQTALVAVEVALAFVLLTGAGLALRTFAAIRATNLGYNPDRVLTHFLALPPSADGRRTAGVALYARIRDRIQGLPGVRAAATASSLPMFGVQIHMEVHPEGEPERRREHQAAVAAVSDSYFRLMEIPLRGGRPFGAADREGSTPVAAVSQSIADRYFGGNALGKRIVLPEFLFNIDGGKDLAEEIVAVVGNVCVHSVGDCQAESIYVPESQAGLRMENLLVRTDGDPMALERAVRHEMYVEAPTIPLDDPETLEHRTGYLANDARRGVWLLGIFAVLALLLAAAGVFAVSAYLTARRSREIGIRMALGAEFSDIAGLVYRGVLVPSAVGVTAGFTAALWLTRLMRSVLFGVGAHDPGAQLVAGGAVLAAAALAAVIPAVRAARTDPAQVLRSD
jgi:putative ABC transport system permease protein